MVTQINKTPRGTVAKTDKSESFADNTKRVGEIVGRAIKSSQEHMPLLQESFAAAYFRAIFHGRTDEINRLYVGLNESDAFAMRSWAIPRVMDLFGAGGVRDGEDASKWIKRPLDVLKFRAKPEASGSDAGLHLFLVKIGEGTSLTVGEVETIKATKRAIVEAGEDALKFKWITRDAMNALAAPYDGIAYEKDAVRFLMKASKNGPNIGKAVDDIRKLGLFIGLSAGDMSKVLNVYGENVKKIESTPAAESATAIPADHPSQMEAAA